MFRKLLPILIAILLGCLGCAQKKPTIYNGLKKFMIVGGRSPYDVELNLPSTFVSVRDLDEKRRMDTTNLQLNWILDLQFTNADAYCFYDSLNPQHGVLILSGARVDVTDEERNVTMFTVPTVPLNKLFPGESDGRKMIYNSGQKKYEEKTYYKRTFQLNPDSLGIEEFLYMTTKWQSTLFWVRGSDHGYLDRLLLDYEVHPKIGGGK